MLPTETDGIKLKDILSPTVIVKQGSDKGQCCDTGQKIICTWLVPVTKIIRGQ